MTDYRAIVNHVRFWRGVIHHWSTSYSFTGSGTTPDAAACQLLLNADRKMLAATSDTQSQGDAYRCEIYLASGGTPVATYTAFDPSAQANWTQPASSAWGSSNILETAAEVAYLVEWPAGLSSGGKPVTFKKFFHQVPRSAATSGAPDINTAQRALLVTAATALGNCLNPGYGLLIGNSHRIAGTPIVRQFYVNHQMPRGRRKKVTSEARSASFGARVLQLAENEAYGQANS